MKHVHVVRWAVAAAMGLACLASAVAPAAAGAAGPLTFSAPAKIAKARYASTHNLTALNCISTTLCVAGDAAGNLITSTHPTSGASAWTVAEQVDPSTRINAVSCSSTSLCVAAGNDGAIIHSRNPTGGTSAWKLTTGVFRSGNALTSLSCATKKLCFGVDKRGQVIYSRNPTGSARTWKFAHILTYSKDWLVSIKCPTTSECVALDRRGHTVLHSTKPTGGKKAWRLTTLNTRATDSSFPTIACASRSLCVIAGGQGSGQTPFIATSTHPTGGSSAWRIGRPPKAITNLVTVSCPTTKFCAVGGRTFGTEIAYSTRPSAGAKTYKAGLTAPTSPPSGYPGVDGLSCASASQCVFFAANGQVGVTNKPTTTSTSDWPTLVVDAYNKLESVACPSATVCVAGGTQKTVYTSANPTGGAGAWRTTALPIASDRVSCGATNQCVVGDGIAGDLAATSTPLSGGWIEAQTSGDLPDGGGIAVLSCTTGPFCIAGPYEVQSDSDDEGTTALTTSNPTGGTSAWNYSTTFIEGGINGGRRAAKGVVPSLTCPSQTLCVAGDAKGAILTNVTPTNIETWHYTRPDGKASINDLSCPSTSLCVGADSQGRVIHSTNPTSGKWSGATIDKGFALTAVSCASTGFCVAVDGHRHAFVTTNPTGGVHAWQMIGGVDGDLTSIACPTTGLCVAVDGQGNEVTAGR
ncbi:MAG: hypothetical protein QOF83_3137 [Solirubrobacteraceae bacterium]|nr:hypothetical protein [Solirubrobacteraceae bacterium]